MDETKKAPQDKSSLKDGQPSGETKGITSETENLTYTQEQLNEAITNAKSDALATAGRTATALEKREAAIKAREDAAKAEQERRDAAELAEAQKDPDRLAEYQSKQAERQRKKEQDDRDAAQDKREAEYDAKIEAAEKSEAEHNKEILIFEIASAKNIDPMNLKNLAEKFNVEGKEKLEEMATEIAAGKFKGFEADNAMTKGGTGDKSEEQKLKDRYPSMK